MHKKRLSILTLCLSLLFAFSADAEKMIDLPANNKITSMTILYCVTGDQAGARDLLRQRLKYINQNEDAADQWIKSGYCRDFLNQLRAVAPNFETKVKARLEKAGFNPAIPISEQVAKSGTTSAAKIKLGKILKDIGKGIVKAAKAVAKAGKEAATKIAAVFRSKAIYVSGTSTETKPDGTVIENSFSYCDKTIEVSISLNEAVAVSDLNPTPYNPNTN